MASRKAKTAAIKKTVSKAAKSTTLKRAKTAAKKLSTSGIKDMEQELSNRFAEAADGIAPPTTAKSLAKKYPLYLLAGAATVGAITMFVRFRRGSEI